MSRRISFSILMIMVGVVSSLNAAPTPTPTPTPKKSFLSVFKPRRNPAPTRKISAGVGRGTHLGIDRSAQSPTPRPVATPKPKSSPTTAGKSAPSQMASPAPAKSPTPSGSPSPHVASSPQNSPEEELPPIQSGPLETASPTPTPIPMPSATGTTAPEPTPTATITATPAPSISPAARPTKIEVTLTRFEPPRGSPGDRNYRSAQLSYRINVPNRMEYPTINFTVETSTGKLFERVVQLPPGSAFVEPGDNTEHTSALDPVDRADWASAYAKADRATFNWSIEGQSSGHSEMSVKKPWP